MSKEYNLKFSNKLEDSEEYMNKLTSNWYLEASEGTVSLYKYHDSVDWDSNYAIAVEGVVKSLLKGVSYGEAYNHLKVVADCLS